MLEKTFIHLPGVGAKTEQSLWDKGIHSWEMFCDENACTLPFAKRKSEALRSYLVQCRDNLCRSNPHFFEPGLSSQHLWRLFADFRDCAAYLDIETTGLGGPSDHITTVALYDGREVFYYVHGDNLDQFREDIAKYKMIITYNGRCFDVPFINSYFGITLDQVHIDLRFVLSGLGYRGGLKGCEKKLGLSRDELDGVDGYFAVILWQEYRATRNPRALETLLAYNIVDAVNLEILMVKAFNLKVLETPFPDLQLPLPASPPVPFRADGDLITRLRKRYGIY
jgi:uncharacterized protein